jgi:hypothetical protein
MTKTTYEPADNLLDARHACNPEPLAGEAATAYYVPRTNGVDDFIEDLRTATPSPHKYLFTGHFGCGKTTELLRLISLVKDRYFPVYVNVETALDLADIGYQDVILAFGLQTFRAAKDRRLKLPAKLYSGMLRWFRETIWEEAKLVGGDASAEAKLDAYVFKLSGRLASEGSTRKTVRTKVENNLTDLLRHLDEVFAAVQKKSGRQVLLVADGLDKVFDEAVVRKLYVEGVGNLLAPECKAIYTAPFSLFQSPELGQVYSRFAGTFPLPNIRLRSRAGAPNAAGRTMLREALFRRVQAHLFAPEAVDRLIDMCGGVLRELIVMTGDAFLNARQSGHTRLELPDTELAINDRVSKGFGWLTPSHFRELAYVREHKRHTNSAEARELIRGLAVLGYLDSDRTRWWDAHPALLPQLAERADELADPAAV